AVPGAPPAPDSAGLPRRVGDLDQLHLVLATPGGGRGLRGAAELPTADRGHAVLANRDGDRGVHGRHHYREAHAGSGLCPPPLARPCRGRGLVFPAVFPPWTYPASVAVMGWYWTLSPPIATAYSTFMGQVKHSVDSALGGGAWVFLTVILFNIWRGSSFIGVLLLAGINAIPPELFEYALLESKSPSQPFRSVTVPLLKPFLGPAPL